MVLRGIVGAFAESAVSPGRALAAACMLSLAWASGGASGQALPSVRLTESTMVWPENAWAIMGSSLTRTTTPVGWTASTRPAEIKELARALGAQRLTNSAYSQAAYQYVRDNIRTEFRFGLSKGARGAIVDQSGTPFDQAHLFVELLREGGVPNVSYRRGAIQLTSSQFGKWTGLVTSLNESLQTFSVNRRAACEFMADGGIPVKILATTPATACSSLSGSLAATGNTIEIAHIWVVADGQLYDPSFKFQKLYGGIDLPAAMGCRDANQVDVCASTVLAHVPGLQTQAGTGSGASSVRYVQGSATLQSNINQQLRNQGLALEGWIQNRNRTTQDNISTAQVVGGSEIDLGTPFAFGPQLPYTVMTGAIDWVEIPDTFRTQLRVQIDNINTVDPAGYWLFADEIYGKRLRLWGFANNGSPTSATRHLALYLEYKILQRSGLAGATREAALTLQVNHPYPGQAPGSSTQGSFADEAQTLTLPIMNNVCDSVGSGCTSGDWFVHVAQVVHGWGDSSESTVAHFGALAQRDRKNIKVEDPADPRHIWRIKTYPPAGTGSPSCPEGSVPVPTAATYDPGCLETHQAVVSSDWAAQVSRSTELLEAIYKVGTHSHHSLGYMLSGPNLGANVLSVQSMVSARSMSSSNAVRLAAFRAYAALASRHEGGVFEQTFQSHDGASAVSFLARASDTGKNDRYLEITTANLTNALNVALQSNYSQAQRDAISAYVQAGHVVIAPRSGQLGVYTNGASSSINYDTNAFAAFASNNTGVAYIVRGFVKGANGTSAPDPLKSAKDAVALADASVKKPEYFNVDLQSATLRLEPPPDVSVGVGAFPHSLGFQRYYSSQDSEPGIDCGQYPVGQCNTFYEGPLKYPVRTIGAGWTHALEIFATVGSSGLAGLSRDNAANVAPAIVALYALRTLQQSTGLRQRVATILATDWWVDTWRFNVRSVVHPPGSSSFYQLLSGSFNPDVGATSTLTQSGTITLFDFQPGFTRWNFAGLSFAMTDKHGSVLSLGLSGSRFTPGATEFSVSDTNTYFLASSWQYPDGLRVNWTYTTLSTGNVEACSDYVVSNNLGRSLTFVVDGVFNPPITLAPDSCGLRAVRDTSDPTRVATLSTDTYNAAGDNRANGIAISRMFVKNAAGEVSRYDYAPTPDAHVERSTHRVSAWYTPSDGVVPFRTVEYDSLARVRTLTDNAITNSGQPAPRVTQYFSTGLYGAEEIRRGEIVDANGGRTTQVFDRWGRELSTEDPLGRRRLRTYDGAHRLSRDISPELNEIRYRYDARHNLIEVRRVAKPSSGFADIVTTTTYVEGVSTWPCAQIIVCNRPATETDGRLNSTSYTWVPGTGLLETITSPQVDVQGSLLSPVTSLGYTSFAATGGGNVWLLTTKTERITSATDTVTTRYTYNPSNRLVLQSAVEDFGGLNLTSTLTFDGIGNVVSIDGPRTDVSDVTTYAFDAMRRVTRVNAPLNSIVRYTYDLDGQVTGVRRAVVANPTDSDPTNPRPSDLLGAHWQTEARTYWPTGELRRVTNPEGHVTEYRYDALSRLQETIVPVSPTKTRVTRNVYDLAGQLLEEYRGWGTADQIRYSRRGYTPNGRVDYVDDPVQSTVPGQPSSAASPRTDLVYDGHDRLSRMTMPDPVTGNPNPNDYESYEYDAAGNRTTKRNRSGASILMSYDALNREHTRTVPANAALPAGRVLTTSYDLRGQKRTLTAEGQSISYFYDKAGRIDYVTDVFNGNSYVVNHEHDAAGNRVLMTWPGGGSLTYTFDALNQMRTVSDNLGITLATYAYDQLSRRDSVTFGNGVTSNLDYFADDALERLEHGGAGGRTGVYSFGRNQSNQIETMSIVANSAAAWSEINLLDKPTVAHAATYVPDKLNRYSSVAGAAYTYDSNGNLTSDGVFTFAYDEENRLRTASTAGQTTTYKYDPAGRRREKLVVGGTNAGTFVYLSDGVEEIEERDHLNVVRRRYAYGPGVDDRIAMLGDSCGSYCYYQTNHQGSTIALSRQDASLSDVYGYDAFGRSSAGPLGNQFRYTGRRFDPDTGLYYYRARYYSSNIGRFLQTDPIGTKDDLNLYAYTYNDPLNAVDPTGLGAQEDLLGGFAQRGFDNMCGQGVSLEFEGVDTSSVWFTIGYYFSEITGGARQGGRGEGVARKMAKSKKAMKVCGAGGKGKGSPRGKSTSGSAESAEPAANSATARRVQLRKGVREQIDANQPRNAAGERVDPNDGQPLIEGEIDIGHKKGHAWRDRKKMHEALGSTRKEVIEAENDPDLYHLEHSWSNRGHKHE